MSVDRVGRAQPEGVSGLRRVEGTEDEVVGSSEERTVVGGEPFHHVNVAAEQQQEDGTPGE